MSRVRNRLRKRLKFEEVKRARRVTGAIYEFPGGRRVYLADRKHGEIYRSGNPTITDAIKADTAAWSIDNYVLSVLRAKAVPYVGVLVRETGDIWIAPLEDWTNPELVSVKATRTGGEPMTHLPLHRFVVRYADPKL